jgi:peptidyl-tRNA hydrolase, PTH1 family
MKLIVGLGNPGFKYERTRHNIGFLAVDAIAQELKASQWTQKNKALFCKTTIGGEDVLLIKPQTFMNLSGESVGIFYHFHKCEPQDVIVFHDELDITPGLVRIKKGGGNGGHNGLRSLDACLGTADYFRIRLGVGHPRSLTEEDLVKVHPSMDAADFVLSQFTQPELDRFVDNSKTFLKILELVVQNKANEAMNRFHKK